MKVKFARKLIDQERETSPGKRRKVGPKHPAATGAFTASSANDATPQEYAPPKATANLSLIHGPGDVVVHQEPDIFRFPYRPLDTSKLEIRIITLKPGTGSSPIECEVQHVATNTKSLSSYKALSYTWGPVEPTRSLSIDGVNVEVRENLWQALYHIRQPEFEVQLWVDAICINQEDVPERNQQVSRMGTLYNQAEEVIVWLGPDGDGSDIAISFIRQTISSPSHSIPLDLSSDLFSSVEVRATLNLLSREYWRRLWIVQEVFRARKIVIYCGHQILPWKDLAKFFRRVKNLVLRDMQQIAKNPSHEAIIAFSHNPAATLSDHRTSRYQDLESLLISYNGSLCCDPRDKIYSLLGLARQRLTKRSKSMGQQEWLSIDYSRTPYELFQVLTLMYLVDIVGDPLDRFLVRWMQLLQKVLDLPPPWSASRFPCPESTVAASLTLGTITCKSYPPTVIASVSPEFVVNIDALALEIGQEPKYPVEYDPLLEWYSHYPHPRFPSEARLLSVLQNLSMEDIARLCNFKQGHAIASHQPVVKEELRDILETAKLRLFVTRNGRLGITAYDVLIGEEVVRFYGSDIALVTYIQFKGNPLPVRGRAFIVPSDNTERDPDFLTSYNATFKYAVPSRLDEKILDIGIGDPNKVHGKEMEHYDESKESTYGVLMGSMTLEQWEYWTW